jgi:hypothetical protein
MRIAATGKNLLAFESAEGARAAELLTVTYRSFRHYARKTAF